MRYGMAVDVKLCLGCFTCSMACKQSNNLPNNIWYNTVHTVGGESMDTASGVYPNLEMGFMPVNCLHCAEPACLDACPTGATRKRDDGIVWIDNDLCIGCEACVKACPYEGVRTLLSSDPEYYLDIVVGEYDAPTHKAGTMEKCTFCKNLIDRGEVPACMVLCPGRARFWGDLDDPESEISKVIAGRELEDLVANSGTSPSVFYLK